MAQDLRDAVERWLTHESYKFKNTTAEDDSFRITVSHVGSFGNAIEIFEPKSQPDVLVLGAKCPLKNSQNARFLKFSDQQKAGFEGRVTEYCKVIGAVHRFSEENGKKTVGIYAVLDKKEQLNHGNFAQTIQKVSEMSEKMTRYLMKTF